MANPTVDKLKVFGLRHGEKVAMGVVAVAFVGCSYLAWSHPSIDVTPDEVKKTADAASENLNRKQDDERIKTELEKSGVALANFEKIVDVKQAGSIDASKFKIAKPVVRLEPGAGLIRDTPELIAPTDLIVHAGRGAIKVVVLDENNMPKQKAEEKAKSKATAKKAETAAEREKRKTDESDAKKKAKGIAGVNTEKEDTEQKAAVDTDIANIETTVRGYRWVTMIGRLDHAKMRELHAKAIKTDEADPHYLRLELERQVQSSDSEWSEWTPVKRDVYLNVKRVLTDEEAERVPKDSILAPLVDPLPFLQVGYWVGAHHGALLPKEVLTPKPVTAENGEPGVGRGKSGGMMGSSNKTSAGNYAKGGGAPDGGGYGAGMGGMGAMGSNEGMGEGADGRSAGGGAGGGTGRGPADADFDKTKADWIMIRALDFDVEADTVYRYRVRIVVANPNYQWENVSPGVDTKVKELKGPWSVETAAVNVPADVSTYAIQKVPPAADPSGLKVEFQVVKWSPEDGLTVVYKFEQSPGDIIGSKHGIAVPDPKKPDERKTQQYDFTSRQILADVSGGERPPSALQALGTPRFSTPAFALVVRNDGLLVIRDQTTDAGNGEMKEMADIYAEIMKEIGAPKKKGSSSMMGGMGEGGMGGGGGMGNQ